MRYLAVAVAMLVAGCTGGGPAPEDAPADTGVAMGPVLELTPGSLDFGLATPFSNPAIQQITLFNHGPDEVTSLALAVTGPDPIELSIAQTTCLTALAAGDSCTIDIALVPRTYGERSATLSATADGQISATALVHGVVTALDSNTTSPHDFGLLPVGQTKSFDLALTNLGLTTLPAIGLRLGGGAASQFQLAADLCTGMHLTSQQSCPVTIVYAPTSLLAGSDAQLYVDIANITWEIDLRGTATAATTLALSPTTQDFGSVAPPGSAILPFTITNTGTEVAENVLITSQGEVAIASTTCGATLDAGASCTAGVQVVPISTGPIHPEVFAVGTNTTRASALLTALALPTEGVIVDAWSHDFGATPQGTIGTSFTFTVTNVGTMATTIAYTFDDSADQFPFVQDTCTIAPLGAGDTCTFTLSFEPTAAVLGGAFARIHVTTPTNEAIVVLRGIAQPPLDQPLHVTPAIYSYGTLAIGQIASVPFTIENPGAVTKVPAISLAGPSANELVIANDTCTGVTLPASAMCTVDVIYEPATTGAKAASLQVTWSGGAVSATLSGTAN